MSGEIKATVVRAGARIDLQRALDATERRQLEEETAAAAGVVALHSKRVPMAGAFPAHFPLLENDRRHPDDFMLLAARECAKLGEIEMNETVMGAMVRITPAGQAVVARLKDDPLDDKCGPRPSPVVVAPVGVEGK